ncbi:Nitrilotriacetate monooxygenase component B [Candidatus Sulfopaludibacter sp. SbA3]|nr:Nitrilotriacetate monooxygenase component B [Candidatus Sulfopaludibacter sp. SbA3]
MPDFHFYEPSKGHNLSHDPFKAIVAPRPIGWISTSDADGRVNLAPYSFFNAVCDRPPMIMFSSAGWKDTVSNIQATGEFVCNLVTRPLAEKMNQTSASLPRGVNEFEFAGLAPAPSRMVGPPRVADAPAALECRLVQIIQLSDLEGATLDQYMTIGQVVGVHIDRAYLNEGLFDLLATHPVQRAGYVADYTEATAGFKMARPR